MPQKNSRVDDYIREAAPFAQPILKHLRKVVHRGCPDAEETIKWGFPHFDYKGVMAGMAAFKSHCSFGLWKAALIIENAPVDSRDGMGHFGRITKIGDLPPEEVLVGYIQKAAALNEAGIKSPARSKPKREKEPLIVPDYLVAALRQNKQAWATFDGLSYSHQKEYVQWLTEAKRPATREARLAKTLALLAEGKSQNWKYQRRASAKS
ncbi:MAG: YdeI/OmpD-associated family protein [Verrucomicrobiota bacterium]|nr:YdeI/OmpD-associated family protein [Verrucomicrobiota bacterium]